jgi:hypothetical protein
MEGGYKKKSEGKRGAPPAVAQARCPAQQVCCVDPKRHAYTTTHTKAKTEQKQEESLSLEK